MKVKRIFGGHTFFKLLIKEPRNVASSQKIRQLRTSVHGVNHEHRCRQRISSHLDVLNLIAFGIKEAINVDYGSSVLEVIQEASHSLVGDWDWSFEVGRKSFPQPRRLAVEDRFHTPFGYPLFAISGQATTLRFQSSGLSDAQIGISDLKVGIGRTT